MMHKNITAIPATLRDEDNNYKYCCWRYKWLEREIRPVPYNPVTGKLAPPVDPSKYVSLETAQRAWRDYNGIGLLISDNLGAIDIDHCIVDDGMGGKKLTALATDIMNVMDSYAEYSPSGDGIHILFMIPADLYYNRNEYQIKKGDIELYIAGKMDRYITLTGDPLTPGTDLAERGNEAAYILDKYMRRNIS